MQVNINSKSESDLTPLLVSEAGVAGPSPNSALILSNQPGPSQTKISKTRERDMKNEQRLNEMGWTVIRLWQSDLQRDYDASIRRIVRAVKVKAAG